MSIIFSAHWNLFYGACALVLMGVTYWQRARFPYQTWAAAYGLASFVMTNTLHYFVSDEIRSYAYIFLHAIGGLGSIFLWERHKERSHWLWLTAFLFAWSVCSDVAYNGTLISLMQACGCDNPNIPKLTSNAYIISLNVLFLARMLLATAGPLGVIFARLHVLAFGGGFSGSDVGAQLVSQNTEEGQ